MYSKTWHQLAKVWIFLFFFNNLEIHVVVKYFYKSASIEMEKENYDVLWSIDVLVFCLLQNGLVWLKVSNRGKANCQVVFNIFYIIVSFLVHLSYGFNGISYIFSNKCILSNIWINE